MAQLQDIYIGIGSNIDDRYKNLQDAIKILEKHMQIITISKFIETKPMYYSNQQDFLNGVIHARTDKSPREILNLLQSIENDMKRIRMIRNGPRIIDLDLLIYCDDMISEPDLIVPHPRIHERLFVLIPFAEINPMLVHPITKKTIRQMLDELQASMALNSL